MLLQSLKIMARSLKALEAQTADVVIIPNTLRFSSADFSARKNLIQAGERATVLALPTIRQKLAFAHAPDGVLRVTSQLWLWFWRRAA